MSVHGSSFHIHFWWRFRWWRGDRINDWVAGIASHGSGFLSRGWLNTIEAPVDIPGSRRLNAKLNEGTFLHYTAMQLIMGLYPEPQKLVISRFVFGIKIVTVISFFWFPSTALTELEELNLDRTLITDDGCTVLSCKYYLLSGQIVSSEKSPRSNSLSQTICSRTIRPNLTPDSSLQICGHVRFISQDLFQLRLSNTISLFTSNALVP